MIDVTPHRGDGTTLPDVEVDALDSGIESDLQHTQGLGLWFVRWSDTQRRDLPHRERRRRDAG
jgi:hypothetical protein